MYYKIYNIYVFKFLLTFIIDIFKGILGVLNIIDKFKRHILYISVNIYYNNSYIVKDDLILSF